MSQSRPPHDRGSTALDGPERRRRRGGPWWLWLLGALIVIALLLLLLSRCDGGDTGGGASSSGEPGATQVRSPATSSSGSLASGSSVPSDSSAAGIGASSVSPSSPPTVSEMPSSSADVPPSPAAASLTAGDTSLLPLAAAAPQGTLRAFDGMATTGTDVTVLSVPADEGFWVGASKRDRVWVQITGSGESPYRVKVGDRVDLTGTMVRNGPGFARHVGVSPREGAAQLTKQASHISIEQDAVTLHAG